MAYYLDFGNYNPHYLVPNCSVINLESNDGNHKRFAQLSTLPEYDKYRGVSCQKWQFLYFYGHHQKQFVCTFWWRNHGLGRNNSTWQDLVIVDGNLNSRRYIDEILRPVVVPYVQKHGARGIVPGWQRPTPSSQDRGHIPAAGTNHEGGLAGLLTGLKPYWACLGSVGKSSPDAHERGQHTCWPPDVSVGGVG